MELPVGGRWGRARRDAATAPAPGAAPAARPAPASAPASDDTAGLRVADASTPADVVTPRSADEAVRLLYGTHWHQLVRLATLLTRDASVAEELVQDAFVSLHRRWSSLADPAAAHGYLRTTVVNNARSALRHRGVEERYRQPGPPEPSGPEERAVQATEDAQVMAALRSLSRRQQEVLVLRYYADLSEQEIAGTLGMSRGAVKSHAHRGIAALREALAADKRAGKGADTRAGRGATR
jgi:RNA polymerase sigma-70 factor (sigma-E family)